MNSKQLSLKPNILLTLLFVFTTTILFAQNKNKIVGLVTDKDNTPLINASVIAKNLNSGFSAGTTTDSTGKFFFYNLPEGSNYSFTVSSTNYKPLELLGYSVNAGDTISLLASLESAASVMDEVVVIGYGSQAKKDLTMAVSSIKTQDMVLTQGPDIGDMLKGKMPGLTIRKNSAQPGGGLDILIRGAGSVLASNSPLVVVNDFPISDVDQPNNGGRYQAGTSSILSSFNPNDIESVEILKDATATAIYGARAANGVILITTKKGKEGSPRVEYNVDYNYQPFVDPFKVLPLNEWMQVRNEASWEQWQFDNQVIPYGTRTLQEAIADPLTGEYRQPYTQNAINHVGRGTDWISLVTRDGHTIQHNLSLSGGNKFTKYFLSGNYYNQDGIIKNSQFKRYSIVANLDQKINQYLSLGLNIVASRINHTNSQLGDDEYENSGIIRAAIQQGPHIPAIDEFGNYPLNPQLSLQPNPYSLLTITDRGLVERFLLNTYLNITPAKDWLIRLKLGVDRGHTERGNYLPRTTIHGALENGKASLANLEKNNYLLEATSSYGKNFNGHHFDVLVGTSLEKFKTSTSQLGNSGFITDAFLWYNMNAGSGTKTVDSYGSESAFASFFGRFNYNYKNRYLATITSRTDGASALASKWGTFPSAAIGWNIAEEDFFGSLKNSIQMLKLRVSYGQTGNASIPTNAFAAYSAYPAWLSENDGILIGVGLAKQGNPDLKWETTTQTNIGLDFAILNNRIDGSIDVYQKIVSDLLDFKALNSYQVVNIVASNIGKTQSRGIEIGINSRNILKPNFTWRTMFVASKFEDRWLERSDDWKPSVYESAKDPLRPMFYRISDGILQLGEKAPASQPELIAGQIKIKDIDGFKRDVNGNPEVDENGRFIRTGQPDGIIDDADTRLIGTTDPGFMVGLTNIFTYKNFSLNFDFNGLFGRKMADPNFTAYGISAFGVNANGYNALQTVKDRWTPENPSTTQPSSYWGFSPYSVGDFFLQDAWFIRLQSVSIGYTLPKKWTNRIVSNIRVNAGGQNLFVITPYKGVDPETDSYTAAYPNLRSYNLGINVTF